MRPLAFSFVIFVLPLLSSAQCILVVDQVAGSPSITRISGNSVIGGGTLRVSQPAVGNWVVTLTAHLRFRPLGSGTFTEVSSYTSERVVYNGSIGTLISSGNASATLQPRGDGEYQTALTTVGACGGYSNIPLTPTNPAPSDLLSVRRPVLDTRGIAGMWWLGGVHSDSGYYDAAHIWGTPNWQGTLKYEFVNGSQYAALSCSNCNEPDVVAAMPSPTCQQNVVIRAHLDGFYSASTVAFMVNSPNRRVPAELYTNNRISETLLGWWSKDYFGFQDKCNWEMTTIAHHERFNGNNTVNWEGGASSWWTVAPEDPAGWAQFRLDSYTTWDDIVGLCADSGCSPQTMHPSQVVFTRSGLANLEQNAVSTIGQEWWLGDATPSGTLGYLTTVGAQVLYRDHAQDVNY